MSREAPDNLLARHEAFLSLVPVARPLVGFWLGGYYPAEQFPTGTATWRDGQELRPADVSFAPFAADYENLFRIHQQADDDFFYVGSAYWGMPWMEAILGCPVFATGANCRAEACLAGAGAVPALDVEPYAMNTRTRRSASLQFGNKPAVSISGGPRSVVAASDEGVASVAIASNPWFQALLRFTDELVAFSAGRFPVCPPLLRGPGDCASAMLGGMPFVMGFHDEPEQAERLLAHCSRTRLDVIRALRGAIPSWHGTHAAGGYPSKLWCRRPVAYCQEDSAALLSPDLFRHFLLPLHREQCRAAEVNFIHLHSSCLYPVDILLENRCYDVLEINIDHPGGSSPSLPELLPTLKKIQAARVPLLLWGELTPPEWRGLRNELSPVGLSLQPIVRQANDMAVLLEVLR